MKPKFASPDWLAARPHAALTGQPKLVYAVVAVTVFLTSWASIELGLGRERVTTIWVANSILLAAILKAGRSHVAGLLAVGYLANSAANLVVGDDVLAAFLLAACNTLEVAICTAFILWRSETPDFTRQQVLAYFSFVAAGPAAMTSAVISALVLVSMKATYLLPAMTIWYPAHCIGLLTMTPILMIVDATEVQAIRRPRALLRAGIVVLALATALANICFQTRFPLLFVVFPTLLLATFMFGMAGGAAALLITIVVTVWATHIGYGPIYLMRGSSETQAHNLQFFFAAATLQNVVVGTVLAERTRLVDAAIREDRKANRKYKALLDAAPDAIVVDQNGEIVLVNSQAEALFGYQRAEMLGRRIESLLPSRYAGSDSSREGLSVPSPLPSVPVPYGQRKDQSEFPIEIKRSPLETDEGILVLTAVRDITERRRDEAALRETNAQLLAAVNELDAFSYSVSHDLRAPLRAISGFSQILFKQCGPTLTPERRELLRLVCDNAAHMGHLVDDLLAFSRLGRQPLRKEVVTTSAVVNEVLAVARREASGRVVRVSVGDIPNLWGDPALISQVFVNLIGNAFKYTRGRSEAIIQVGAETIDREQIFFVRDNGAGFDMQYADKLFGVFQRQHRAEEFEGTGVGLAIVQRIIQRHGGRVWAEAAIDRGATFYFTVEAFT